MRDVRSTRTKFERPVSFRYEEKLAHSIGIHGGTPERVRLRLTEMGAKLLRWGMDVEVLEARSLRKARSEHTRSNVRRK